MATIYINASGSGVFSSDLTSVKANVMENKTAITYDSNDSSEQGTLPLAAVKIENGGTLQINGVDSFSASQSTSMPNTVVFNIDITAKIGRPWGGYYVRYKEGDYPTSITDGIECGYYSQNGGTYTFPDVEATTTYYFRAWDFYRYNERGDTTYDSICWGAYHNSSCQIKRHTVPYIRTFAGDINQNVSGSITVPIGYTHADVAVVACGGWSGVSYFDITSTGESGNETNSGTSGGEGGEVTILSLNCSQGQTMSWNIGKIGTKPSGTFREYSDTHWSWREPYSQGTAGTSTTFTFNGTTYTSLAGNNGTSGGDSDSKAGGTGTTGADGGAANNTRQGIGGSGTDGMLFTPTNIKYGGGGCGVGKSYSIWTSSSDVNYYGVQGTKGATDGAYGHGGNAAVAKASIAQAGQAGAIIISFT